MTSSIKAIIPGATKCCTEMKNFDQYEEPFNSKSYFQRRNVKTIKVNNKIVHHLRNEQRKFVFLVKIAPEKFISFLKA
jgi:hypothetical protein